MNILVIGDQKNFSECREKFGNSHEYVELTDRRAIAEAISGKDLVFDFTIHKESAGLENYAGHAIKIFLNVCAISLAQLAKRTSQPLTCTIFGFNGMPTFLNTSLMEVCVWRDEDKDDLEKTCAALKTTFSLVDDRVGLVTSRIICMVINEAYYTVQEGTASRQDVDKAMKLGTNYPHGPFEWAGQIGVRNIYDLLSALYEDTKDERYKICALLKKDYLKTT